MGEKLKVLTCCSAGNNRSVCAGYFLKHKYTYDSLACGVDSVTSETLVMLCEWADIILICGEESLLTRIPTKYHGRCKQLGIGPDIWSPSYHPELAKKTREALKRIGMLPE